MEFRNSTRGPLIALESKCAIGYYLQGIIKDTKMKMKAYRLLASSKTNAELVGQPVSLPRGAVLLRQFHKRVEKFML